MSIHVLLIDVPHRRRFTPLQSTQFYSTQEQGPGEQSLLTPDNRAESSGMQEILTVRPSSHPHKIALHYIYIVVTHTHAHTHILSCTSVT